MKLMNLSTLLFIVVAVLGAVACTPTSQLPPEHDDNLTDPFPTRVRESAPLAPAGLTPIAVNSPATTTSTPAPVQVTVSVADLLRQYLADVSNTPGLDAAWYEHVRQITVRFNTATIRTDLTTAPPDQAQADAICRAVAAFPKSPRGDQRRSIDVQVYGQQDRLLASSHDNASHTTTSDGFVSNIQDP